MRGCFRTCSLQRPGADLHPVLKHFGHNLVPIADRARSVAQWGDRATWKEVTLMRTGTVLIHLVENIQSSGGLVSRCYLRTMRQTWRRMVLIAGIAHPVAGACIRGFKAIRDSSSVYSIRG